MRTRLGVAAAVIVLTSAACASPSIVARAREPIPAGTLPSNVSKMVCAQKTQGELSALLGVTPVTAVSPRWNDHLYACPFQYANGVMTLSVKELSSWPQTLTYFRQLGTEFGNTTTLPHLGQGGFLTRDGSVVVRKDWKVLLVDISGLPAQFGKPPTSSSEVAVTAADTILGCWAGD